MTFNIHYKEIRDLCHQGMRVCTYVFHSEKQELLLWIELQPLGEVDIVKAYGEPKPHITAVICGTFPKTIKVFESHNIGTLKYR